MTISNLDMKLFISLAFETEEQAQVGRYVSINAVAKDFASLNVCLSTIKRCIDHELITSAQFCLHYSMIKTDCIAFTEKGKAAYEAKMKELFP